MRAERTNARPLGVRDSSTPCLTCYGERRQSGELWTHLGDGRVVTVAPRSGCSPPGAGPCGGGRVWRRANSLWQAALGRVIPV
jgi:hypothetical protein